MPVKSGTRSPTIRRQSRRIPVLDNVGCSSASLAWSPFLKLRSAYTGPLCRVRRSSDSTEQDINAVDGTLDTTSLLAFCAAGSGYLAKVYDQSGNANDLVQTTTANQPIIVSSGVMNLIASRFMATHDSTDLMATASAVAFGSPEQMTHLISLRGGNNNLQVFGGTFASKRTFFTNHQTSGLSFDTGISNGAGGYNIWRGPSTVPLHRRINGAVSDRALAVGVEVVPINDLTISSSGHTQLAATSMSSTFEDSVITLGVATNAVSWDCAIAWPRALSNDAVALAVNAISPSSHGAAIGDSTVAYYSAVMLPVANYLLTDAEKCRYAVAPIAVQGHTIAQQKTDWTAYPQKLVLKWVVIQIGLNDMDPAVATATTIAALQDLVDTVRSGVSSTCKIIICTMTPAYQRWPSVPWTQATAQAKWVATNEAIMGRGSSPITGVDFRREEHTTLLSKDVSGNAALADAYDSGDHIHENAAGRAIVAQSWRYALERMGVL
jgi:hypothetical protein